MTAQTRAAQALRELRDTRDQFKARVAAERFVAERAPVTAAELRGLDRDKLRWLSWAYWRVGDWAGHNIVEMAAFEYHLNCCEAERPDGKYDWRQDGF